MAIFACKLISRLDFNMTNEMMSVKVAEGKDLLRVATGKRVNSIDVVWIALQYWLDSQAEFALSSSMPINTLGSTSEKSSEALSPSLPPRDLNFKSDFSQLIGRARSRMVLRLRRTLTTIEVAKEGLEFYLDRTSEPQNVFTRKGCEQDLVKIPTEKRMHKEDSQQPPEVKKQRLLNDPFMKAEPEDEPGDDGDFAEELSRIVDRASEELADVQEASSSDGARTDVEVSESEVGTEVPEVNYETEVTGAENETEVAEAMEVGGEAGGYLDEENGDALGRVEEEPFVITRELEMAYIANPHAFCGDTFSREEPHGLSDYLCEQCGYSKRQNWSTFKKHIEARHTPESEYEFQCDVCSKRFRLLVFLESHLSKVHENIKPTRIPCTCDKCGKTFNGKEALKRHMLVHSGARPFVCSTCGASFNQNSNLTVHMRSHERNNEALKEWFQCPHCNVRCGNKRGFETHVKSHE